MKYLTEYCYIIKSESIKKRRICYINNSGRNNHGFTLIEIIAVLIVIGILASVTAVIFSSMDEHNLATEVEILKSHLRFAQSRAMSDNVSWGIAFSGNSYTLQRNGIMSTSNLPNDNSSTHILKGEVTVNSTSAVTFDQFGSLIPLDTGINIILSDDDNSHTITVTPNTGFIP